MEWGRLIHIFSRQVLPCDYHFTLPYIIFGSSNLNYENHPLMMSTKNDQSFLYLSSTKPLVHSHPNLRYSISIVSSGNPNFSLIITTPPSCFKILILAIFVANYSSVPNCTCVLKSVLVANHMLPPTSLKVPLL